MSCLVHCVLWPLIQQVVPRETLDSACALAFVTTLMKNISLEIFCSAWFEPGPDLIKIFSA